MVTLCHGTRGGAAAGFISGTCQLWCQSEGTAQSSRLNNTILAPGRRSVGWCIAASLLDMAGVAMPAVGEVLGPQRTKDGELSTEAGAVMLDTATCSNRAAVTCQLWLGIAGPVHAAVRQSEGREQLSTPRPVPGLTTHKPASCDGKVRHVGSGMSVKHTPCW